MKKTIIIIVLVLIVAFMAALLFPDFFEKILAVAAGLLAILGFKGNRDIKKKREEIKKERKDLKSKRKEREEKAEELNKDLKDTDKKFRDTFFSIILIFFLILTPVMVNAEDGEPPPMTKEDLRIPGNYEDLLEAYLEMFDYAMHYRSIAYDYEELYNESEADNRKKDLLLDTYDEMLEKLLQDSGLG
ncbi:MAG: hypothetical protein ACOCRU_03110, partial [bacterium]